MNVHDFYNDSVNVKVAYSDIYGDISKQKDVSVMYVAFASNDPNNNLDYSMRCWTVLHT